MHSALLIDEILRQIFYFSSENDRSSLVSAARACKAWKDPALDFIWDRLFSFGPLLLLLPSVSVINGEYVFLNQTSNDDLGTFHSYAQRVKHVSHRQEIKIHPSVGVFSPFSYTWKTALPNLATAHISIPRCTALLMPLNLSPALRHLDIDLGFKATSSFMDTTLCEYLEQVNACCPELRRISLRGLASKRLNRIISSMRLLHSLSLRLGHSLLPETFMAVIGFPHLLDLEIHAGHIEYTNLDDIHVPQDYTTLPSLSKLHIRAKTPTIENILHHIQPNTLQHLHIELDDISPSTTSWDTIFVSISNKTGNTLRHLALEHHFEIPEPISSIPSDTNQTSQITPSHITPCVPIETMQGLRGLKHLRHFSCDFTLPPAMSNQDIGKLVTWWPDLEHLDLGCGLQTDEFPVVGSSQMTISALALFATRLPKLRKLILPLIIDDLQVLPPAAQNTIASQVQSLTVAQLETSNPMELVRYLHQLFPFLQDLEGPCEDSQVWTDTKDALRSIVHKTCAKLG
ncbi:hypothetical protein BDZ97DRAFT_1916552 [Flammula alnicola]|nr:hypothetical protein BDZ97DRAFT_1916552 [Flammula alnicola]